MLRETMEDAEIVTCGSVAEALGSLSEKRFDLITTGLMLPDQDGLELCRQIRQSETHHYTPIIVISGDDDERLLKEGFEAGVTEYFDKSQGYHAFGLFIKNFSQRNTGLVGRVLYVEDSRTAATVTGRIFERHGMQVVHTTTAEEAIEHIKAAHEGRVQGFDMVITDFFLEGKMTGGDLLHCLRAHYHYSQQEMPVLVITGNDDSRTQVEVFHAGANDFVSKPLVEEVLMARVRSLLLIKHQYVALQRQNQTMEQVANTDALTGVYNRRYLGEHGEQMLKSAESQPLWAMIIDIDHFKQINDHNGHLVGDHVLAAMGKLLQENFPDAMVVRFGGEEFALLLPGVEEEEASARAEKFRQAVEQLHPDGVAVAVSIGLASSADYPMIDLNNLIKVADKALYAAKGAGRNRLCISRPHRVQKGDPAQHASL